MTKLILPLALLAACAGAYAQVATSTYHEVSATVEFHEHASWPKTLSSAQTAIKRLCGSKASVVRTATAGLGATLGDRKACIDGIHQTSGTERSALALDVAKSMVR